jgi:hypothetical protein
MTGTKQAQAVSRTTNRKIIYHQRGVIVSPERHNMKTFFFLFLFSTQLLIAAESKAQPSAHEIPHIPPQVEENWLHWMRTLYYDRLGRYGTTTWYIDGGTFQSITVYRMGSSVIRVFMYFTATGELLSTTTDE